MNRVEITGMVFGLPKLIQTKSGKHILTFSIGHSIKKGDSLNFFRVKAFSELAISLADIVFDRSRVKIEGFLTQNKFERKDGSKGESVDIVARSCTIVEKKYKSKKTEPTALDIDFNEKYSEKDLEDIPL